MVYAIRCHKLNIKFAHVEHRLSSQLPLLVWSIANTNTHRIKWICLVFIRSTSLVNNMKLPRNWKKQKKQQKKTHQKVEPMNKCMQSMHFMQLCHSVCTIFLTKKIFVMAGYAKQYGNNERLVATDSTERISRWVSRGILYLRCLDGRKLGLVRPTGCMCVTELRR